MDPLRDLRPPGTIGRNLVRPECVLCVAAGDVFVSHFRGGVTRIAPDGTCSDILGDGDTVVATNGFAIGPEGDFLCANLSPPGGVWRIGRDGSQSPVLTEVDGQALVSVNFVHVDREARIWATVSTRRDPRHLAYRPDVDDGFVVLLDRRGARVAAQGFGYTNEAKVDPTGRWLYVNETFGRRTSRLAVSGDGTLGPRETVTEYAEGTYPDGLEFDREGAVWITSVISNRLIRVTADGVQQVLAEDSDAEEVAQAEAAFRDNRLGRAHLDGTRAVHLKGLSSVAFGGPDMKTGYLGNLLDDRIYRFASPVAGAEPPHWRWRTPAR